MADSTSVNPQITDALTQSRTKVLAEAPAMAVGALYQALAHSTGLMYENAVAAQQQQNTIAQAATTQGVMQIYSLDTATTGISATQAVLGDAADALDTGMQASAAHAASALGDRLNAQVEAAVRLDNEIVLAHAAEVAQAVRTCSDAMAAALQSVGQALHEDRIRTLKLAATAVCLRGMLSDPSKAADYAAALAVIERLH